MALAIDAGALEGSGTSGNPTGIKNTAGINTVTFAAANPTWAETVNMESQVALDNALVGNLSYILRSDDYGSLKTTEKATGTAQFVVDRDGRINNYGVVVSNQPTSGDHYFGNFSDLLVGFFGGLDIVVDPYSTSTKGAVRVVGIQMIDVAVRNAVSFCLGNDTP
jgi:HK97 family phage major capsid protein